MLPWWHVGSCFQVQLYITLCMTSLFISVLTSQAMQQHHAITLALGAGLEEECQDLDAVGLKKHFSNVEIPLKIACTMQECCVVRYAEKGHATKPISYITAGRDNSTCSVYITTTWRHYTTIYSCKTTTNPWTLYTYG